MAEFVSFLGGFAKGMSGYIDQKLLEEQQEKLLKKQFLEEEKKRRAELEATSNKYHDTAVGLQEAYGLTPRQTNTIYFNLQSGITPIGDVQKLAQQFAAQNSRPSKTEAAAATAPAVPETSATVEKALEPAGDVNRQTTDLLRSGRSQPAPSVGYAGNSLSYSPFFEADFSGKLGSYIRPEITDPTQVLKARKGTIVPSTNHELFDFANELRNNGELNFQDDPERQKLLLSALEERRGRGQLLPDEVSAKDSEFTRNQLRRGAAQTLLEDPLVRSKWINHVVQREYKGFVDEGDSDNVARTKALISVTAGPEYASAWDGTGKGLNSLLDTLQQMEGQDEEDFLGASAYTRLSSALTEGRQLGQLPTIEQLDSKKDDQDPLTRSGSARRKFDQAKRAANRLNTEASYATAATTVALSPEEALKTRGLGTSTSAPPPTIIPASPSKVGYRTLTGTGMPYAEAGLARMPQLVSSITSLELSTFDKMSVETITAAITNREKLVKLYEAEGNTEGQKQAEMDAEVLKALLKERTPDPDAFLKESFIGKKTEELVDITFQLEEYIDSPDTPEKERESAIRRLEKIKRYIPYVTSGEFSFNDFVKDPILYAEVLKAKDPVLYEQMEPVLKRNADANLLKGVDFDQYDGMEDIPVLDLYLQVAKERLDTLPEDDVEGRKKADFNIKRIKATAKGIIDANPEKFTEETLIAEGIAKYRRLQDAEAAWKQSKEKGESPQIQKQKEEEVLEAEQAHKAHEGILKERKRLLKLVDPEADTRALDRYSDNVKDFTLAQLRYDEALASGDQEEIAKAGEELKVFKSINETRAARVYEDARLKAQAEEEAKLKMLGGRQAVGLDGEVRRYTEEEIAQQGLVGLPLDVDFSEQVTENTTRDQKGLTLAKTAQNSVLTAAGVAGELAEIVETTPGVLTSVADVVKFMKGLETEFSTGAELLNKEDVLGRAQESGIDIIPDNQKLRAGDLAAARSLFKSKLIQLGFSSGSAEGTTGNAMSNQDYNNLMNMISAGGTRNERTFLMNLDSYLQSKISSADTAVNNTRVASGLSSFALSSVAPKARENFLELYTLPTFEKYVEKNPNDFRVKNYQKFKTAIGRLGAQSPTGGLGGPLTEGQTSAPNYLPAIPRTVKAMNLSGPDGSTDVVKVSQALHDDLMYTIQEIEDNPGKKEIILEGVATDMERAYKGLSRDVARQLLDLYLNTATPNQ